MDIAVHADFEIEDRTGAQLSRWIQAYCNAADHACGVTLAEQRVGGYWSMKVGCRGYQAAMFGGELGRDDRLRTFGIVPGGWWVPTLPTRYLCCAAHAAGIPLARLSCGVFPTLDVLGLEALFVRPGVSELSTELSEIVPRPVRRVTSFCDACRSVPSWSRLALAYLYDRQVVLWGRVAAIDNADETREFLAWSRAGANGVRFTDLAARHGFERW